MQRSLCGHNSAGESVRLITTSVQIACENSRPMEAAVRYDYKLPKRYHTGGVK